MIFSLLYIHSTTRMIIVTEHNAGFVSQRQCVVFNLNSFTFCEAIQSFFFFSFFHLPESTLNNPVSGQEDGWRIQPSQKQNKNKTKQNKKKKPHAVIGCLMTQFLYAWIVDIIFVTCFPFLASCVQHI